MKVRGAASGRLDTDGHEESAAIAVADPAGRVSYWSSGAQLLLGYTVEEAVGRNAADVFGDSGSELRHRDGRLLDVRAHAYPLLDGGQRAGFLLMAVPGNAVTAVESLKTKMFDQFPTVIVIYNLDLRVLWVNQECMRVLGFSEGELNGMHISEFLKGPGLEDAEKRIRRVTRTGKPEHHEDYIRLPGESRGHLWAAEFFPLKDPVDRVQAVAVAATNYTQQFRSRQRLTLMSDARARIGVSLDVAGTARELVEVAAPRFADFVSVDLLETVFEGGQPPPVMPGPVTLRRAASRSAHPSIPEVDLRLTPGRTYTHPPSSPITRCLTTSRAVLYNFADSEMSRWLAEDPPHGAWARAYGAHSLIVVPVRARSMTLGAVLFIRRATSPEPFTPDDLSIAEDLVARAAICVDNSRRYTRERGVALALQRDLLPHDLPQHSSVEAATRYQPAGGGARVGGDWFDVIPLSSARIGLVVGDVVGHGIHASATMGRLRTAVRTLADMDLPPDELLTHLDDIVTHSAPEQDVGDGCEIAGDVGATCLYAVYDPASHTCSLARAGHPPPILVRPDGTAHLVDLPAGPPLGLGSLPFEATEFTVPEASLLALFTDGLFETRDHDIDERLSQLCSALARPSSSLETLCDSVLKTMRHEPQADDVALLVARTHVLDPSHVASWELPCDPATVSVARKRTHEQLAIWNLEKSTFTTELVVSELVTNAIRHATGPIQVRLIKDQSLICEVSDGSGTTPHMRRARLSDEGGRGLFLVAQLTQRWGTRHTANAKTVWTEQSWGGAMGCG